MVITVTSARKGQGQTVTAVLLAGMIKKLNPKQNVLIIDTNKMVEDFDLYLNNSTIPLGLDDFLNYHRYGGISEEQFVTCYKTFNGISYMTSNTQHELRDADIDRLLYLAKQNFNYIIFDSSFSIQSKLYDVSDRVIMVTTQAISATRRLGDVLRRSTINKPLTVVINKFSKSAGSSVNDIKGVLMSVVDPVVYTLIEDVKLSFEANNSRLLHYLEVNKNSDYYKSLKNMVERILK